MHRVSRFKRRGYKVIFRKNINCDFFSFIDPPREIWRSEALFLKVENNDKRNIYLQRWTRWKTCFSKSLKKVEVEYKRICRATDKNFLKRALWWNCDKISKAISMNPWERRAASINFSYWFEHLLMFLVQNGKNWIYQRKADPRKLERARCWSK